MPSSARVIALTALLLSLPGHSLAAHFGDALAAYFLQNYEEAHRQWQDLAMQGDRESQFYLGLLYETGKGVDRDYQTAIDWYLKAADSGHAEAAYRLSRLARETDALSVDMAVVIDWIEKAAMGGIGEAQYELGALYAEGRLVERNLESAHDWFGKAEESLADGPKRRQAGQMRQVVEARLAD